MSRPPRLGPRSVRAELGLFAFAPAMAMLAFRSRNLSWWWLSFAVPAVVGCVVAIAAVVVVQRTNTEPFRFNKIDDAGDDVLGHVGGYLLPVVADVSESVEQVVIAGVALVVIVQIHVATGRVHVNPLLYLFGFRTYRATTDTGISYYLITHNDPADWSGARACVPLGSSILIERRRSTRGRVASDLGTSD